jgi:hypothetical protein
MPKVMLSTAQKEYLPHLRLEIDGLNALISHALLAVELSCYQLNVTILEFYQSNTCLNVSAYLNKPCSSYL